MEKTVYVPIADLFYGRVHSNEEFEVRGHFLKPSSGSYFEPPDGGYFEDASILFKDIDFTDIADNLFVDGRTTLYEAILDVADKKALEDL